MSGSRGKNWAVDPAVWRKGWGVHIQPAGPGGTTLKYLGTYVGRIAMSDPLVVAITDQAVTFRWQERQHERTPTLTLDGVQFVRRYVWPAVPSQAGSLHHKVRRPTAGARDGHRTPRVPL